MARGWIRAIRDNPDLSQRIRLQGLVDLDIEAARRLAAEFELGDVVIGKDLAAVLEEAGAEILFDVVVPPARSQVVTVGLEHGCHVLSEKPLASSMAEAEALVALARQAGRIHAVVQNRRFIPGVRRLRRAVAEGLIGDLTAIHGDFFLGPHFGGFREAMDNVLLLDMAIHTFDAARFISGQQPQAVYCLETNPAGSWYRHGAAANAIFQLADGCVFTYRGSWCAPGRPTSWEASWRLVGTRGMITWDGAEAFEATIAGSETGLLPGSVAVDMPDAPENAKTDGHASVIADFLDAIDRGGAPETVSSDNIKSLAMVFAAIESARTGMPVSIAA